MTEPVTDEYYDSQIKNLKLNLNYTVFHIITVKIRTTDLIDVLSELSIKEMIKEALEKISSLYEFGIIDKEVFYYVEIKNMILNESLNNTRGFCFN